MRAFFFFVFCLFGAVLAVTSGPCYPPASCNCPFEIGRDLPDAKPGPGRKDHVCTSYYAIAQFKDCVCKYIPKPEALERREGEIMINTMWADEDLMLNPEW